MSEYVERVVLQVNGKELDDVINSISEDASRVATPVNTMNRARVVRGFKRKNNHYAMEIDAERIVDPNIPDWHALMASDTRIAVIVKPNVGAAVSYGGGAITKVVDGTSDGESTRKISVMFKTRK